MGRSVKKGPFIEPKLALKVDKQKESGARDPIKTWSRACTIPSQGGDFKHTKGELPSKLL